MISYLTNLLLDNITYVSLIAVFTTIYYYMTSAYDKWRKLNIPYASPLLLFGNMFRFMIKLEHMIEVFGKMYYLYPNAKLLGYFQMREPMLMVRDPELINTILVKDFSYFTDHGLDIDPETSVLAKSLFFINGQKWRKMRQNLSPGFTSGKLKDTHNQIIECSDEMVSRITEGLEKTDRLDVKTMAAGFSTDVIGTCAFGLKLDTIKNDDSEFRHYAKILFQNTPKQLIIQILAMSCPWVLKLFNIKRFSHEATDFFYDVFNNVIKHREEHNVIRNDITQTLMEARKELVFKENLDIEDKFTDDDIIANAIIMFTAGSETVSSMLSFCLYELALNKEIQDKLRAEICSMKAKHDGQLNNDYLMDLTYANMVLDEVGRKYSIAFIIMRVATKTYTLPDESFVIEKGQKLTIPMFHIHNDPKYYPDPMRFDPERFSMEQKSQRPKGTYLAFGDGPRLCLGKRFVELEMKLILTNVLSKFEILPCEQTEIPVNIRGDAGFISPKNPIILKFRPVIEH